MFSHFFPKLETETPRSFSPNPDHHKLRISGFANLAFGISRIRWPTWRQLGWRRLVNFETQSFPFKKKPWMDGRIFDNE